MCARGKNLGGSRNAFSGLLLLLLRADMEPEKVRAAEARRKRDISAARRELELEERRASIFCDACGIVLCKRGQPPWGGDEL